MFTYEQINDLDIPIPNQFCGLDSYSELSIYQRNLPHWRQEGATYFVTFRQNDSIPKNIWESLAEEFSWWKKRLSGTESASLKLKRKYAEFQKRYHTVIETSLDDCCGSCLLGSRENYELVESALLFFESQRYHVFACAVMPNHCHVLLQPLGSFKLESLYISATERWRRKFLAQGISRQDRSRRGTFSKDGPIYFKNPTEG